MTELMKRYEAETGDNSQIVWHGGSFASDDYIAWLENDNTKLKKEIANLKRQIKNMDDELVKSGCWTRT